MARARVLEQRRKPVPGMAREALLAATTIQLEPGDLLCGEPGDPVLAEMAPAAKDPRRTGDVILPASVSGKRSSLLASYAAIARGLQASGATGACPLLLAVAQAGSAGPGWQDALAWAQQAELPLLLVCADASGGKPSRRSKIAPVLDWAAITLFSRRTKLPVISVDGEDAVAVYRVMQECVLRTRLGAGPAVIWAVMSPAPQTLERAQLPLARLRQYMSARKISLR